MNVLILGSRGFIGDYLCNNFLQQGYNVVGADIVEVPANVKYNYLKVSRLSSQWENIFSNFKFDLCINAAGSGNVSYSVQNPFIDFEANSLDVIKILDVIRLHNHTCKYIHISSAAVYGNPSSLPIKELDTLSPISPYGFHKKISETLCAEYSSIYNLSIAIVRPFSVFGNGLRKQLLWDICSKMNTENEVELFGTGKETRDFIHISDFVTAINCISAKSNFKCDIYNLATSVETSIETIAKIFEKKYNKKISFNGVSKAGDPIHWRADIGALEQIGFVPKANFESCIIEYINWFKSLQPNE